MFTLSLPRNYRNQQIADFARVEGLPGVYMANQLDASIFDDPSSVPYDKNFNDYLQSKVQHAVLENPVMNPGWSVLHTHCSHDHLYDCRNLWQGTENM